MSEEAVDERHQHADDSERTRELFNTIEFGLDTRKFLESNIGRHVAKRALDEMYAVIKELPEVDPFDHKVIAALQMRHKVATAALSWLGQAVEAGVQAEATLIASESGG